MPNSRESILPSHTLAILAGLAATLLYANEAVADVAISTDATKNMTCSGGICSPTAENAVLNVNDLESLIANSSVQVTTGSEPVSIAVSAAFGWNANDTLTLSAYSSVTIGAPVTVKNSGGVILTTDTGGLGGTLFFGPKGHVRFDSPKSSTLGVNGVSYALVTSVKGLAKAISNNPTGDYALAQNYDATGDGIYSKPPISTAFSGALEGLGNSISNLVISDKRQNQSVGLFETINSGGTIENLRLTGIRVAGGKGTTLGGESVGGLAGVSNGTLQNDAVSGFVSASSELNGTPYSAAIGGLVGQSYGTIVTSQSEGTVRGNGQDPSAGGLVGVNWGAISLSRSKAKIQTTIYADLAGLVGGNYGSIDQSFATGAATTGSLSWVSGLAAFNCGTISNSYSTGAATSTNGGGYVGSFVAYDGAFCTPGTISSSYATGLLTVGGQYSTCLGGFVGRDLSNGNFSGAYWDTDTTGVTNLSQGACNIENDPGIAGLTTAQLQAGLPTGFDPAIWAEDSNINNGFPYLIANPPAK